MSRRALLCAALLVLAVVPYASAGTTQTNFISNASPGHAIGFGQFDGQTYSVGDFDGDGIRELVAFNDNQRLYVLSSVTSRVLAEILTRYPPGWGARPINEPLVTDIDGDGRPEIVAVNSAAYVCVYGFSGGSSWSSMQFHERWCRRMDAYEGGNSAADGGPAAGDVDGDGRKEIFGNTEERGLYAFNHDGSVRWSSSDFGGNAGPLLTDLENDGRKEVIFFGDGGEVRARDASNGAHRWTFFASAHVWPASIPVAGNAEDLDGDGRKEVVFIGRDARDATNLGNNHFVLFVLDSNGHLKWKVSPSWGHPMSYTHPVLVDINGDGKREVLGMDWNTMGHKPGNWEALGPAHVFAYSHTGQLLWVTDVADTWSNDEIVVADVTGDGVQDVLAIGFGPGGDGVWYLDSRNGAKQQHVAIPGWTALRGPVAADFDGSGRLGWAISLHSSGKGGAFAFFKTDAPCRGLYLGWLGERNCGNTGTPPPPPGGGPPPPPPGGGGGAFDASFSGVAGNAWWIQASVSSTGGGIAGVDVRLNGGNWLPLENKGWGWAASYHAPEGTLVQLRARGPSGQIDESSCYRWTSASVVSCSGGGGGAPPPSGGFDATFRDVKGNVWWIQAGVSASGGSIAAVEASINGGNWLPLENKGWGWAASHHAAEGSIVKLRARSTSGQIDESDCYRWASATVVSCGSGGGGGGSPPPSGGFSVQFSNVRGNTFWVETDMRMTGATPQGVDARVNGGSWTKLDLTSWGSWAKGMPAPRGSKVEFRATATDGRSATSQAFHWPP